MGNARSHRPAATSADRAGAEGGSEDKGAHGRTRGLPEDAARVLSAFVARRIPAKGPGVEVEDIVQEVLTAALGCSAEAWPREAQNLRRWLLGIARNKVREALRRERLRSTLSIDGREGRGFEEALVAPQPVALRNELREEVTRVMDALDRLSGRERSVLILRYLEGLGWAGVAARLGLPSADAARKLQQRARAKLAAMLGRAGRR